MTETVGFAGLGIMGSGMVRNLAAKGHRVRIWNRTISKAQSLATSLGIEYAGTVEDLCRSSTVLMLCVTNTSDEIKPVACVEFEQNAGLWTVARFAGAEEEQVWNSRLRAALRLLSDSGFGGGRNGRLR